MFLRTLAPNEYSVRLLLKVPKMFINGSCVKKTRPLKNFKVSFCLPKDNRQQRCLIFFFFFFFFFFFINWLIKAKELFSRKILKRPPQSATFGK